MKKFEGILICTDLDGTLLRNDKTISRENHEAIEYFKSEGGIFTFITGRMPYFCEETWQMVQPNGPFGCVNGGGLFDHDTGKYIWTQTLSPSVMDLVEYVEQNIPGIGVQVNTFEKIYFHNDNPAMAGFRRATKVPHIVRHYRDVDEPIAKIVFCDVTEEKLLRTQSLLDAHPRTEEFDFIRSEFYLYEILPKGISKGSVLPRLAEHLGIRMERTVAIGDYDNDISMIRAAGVGIAVENEVDAVKEAADHITVSNEEHAIAKVISDIESGRLKV